MFAEYIGVRHAIMVNSGSSANLIAFSILTNPVIDRQIMPGDEVIVPAVTWSTSVFPITQVGTKPVLVDVTLDDYNIDVDVLEDALSERTQAIMPVHLLGNPCQMDKIMKIASRNNLYVIEDACEAHGAEYQGEKVGSFGDMGTFSFFFSHHISTIEGGMIVTNNDQFAELAKTLRAHGWVRELRDRKGIAKQYSAIDERFLFINLGYNLRPTEIQGAFGIHQIKKLEPFIQIRRENAQYWSDRLSKYTNVLYLPAQEELSGSRRVWFGYPVTVRPEAPFARKEFMEFLESKGIATRPITAGNLEEQPALTLIDHRVHGELSIARMIMRQSFFWGNHPYIGQKERTFVADCVEEFLKEKL
jgi:CDP-6-deoxy-D-xylo-4-hexulose-3-dehydrase